MAVVNLKGSQIMTGLDASPVQKADVSRALGRVRTFIETVETNADDTNASTYLLARLPSNAVILPNSQIHIDDLATTGSPTVDVGVFNKSGKSDITDDDNLLADGIDVATGATSTSLAPSDIADYGKPLWELLGMSSDPGVDLDVKATLQDAAIDTAGTITLELYVVID